MTDLADPEPEYAGPLPRFPICDVGREGCNRSNCGGRHHTKPATADEIARIADYQRWVATTWSAWLKRHPERT